MRVKTHRMKSSFAGRSFRGLTSTKSRRTTTGIELAIRSEVPYVKIQNNGGVNGNGGFISPARFIEDGIDQWWRDPDGMYFRWTEE